MARAASADFLQNFRFHATTTQLSDPELTNPLERIGQGDDNAGTGPKGEAGFQTVSIPELSTEEAEYNEGIRLYPMKQPGKPEVGSVSLERGSVLKGTSMFEWVLNAIQGRSYRVDLTILAFPNVEAPMQPNESSRGSGGQGSDPYDPDNAKKIICYDAFPTQVKPQADMDASSSDISLVEMEIAVERLGVQVPEGNPIF